MIRQPDYSEGRFFISPILGCDARCYFCYIYEHGYKAVISKNSYSIEQTISYLKKHDQFVEGREGSILSIGAWGDPFPRADSSACNFSLKWLENLAELENPIQIMSRYELSGSVIDGILDANHYFGHVLYSTSISSVLNFQKIEPNADSPKSRLNSVSALQALGISVNVMIKPFISGVTDTQAKEIGQLLSDASVAWCVVGDLLLDDRVKRIFSAVGLESSVIATDNLSYSLDCTSGERYKAGAIEGRDYLSSLLSMLGIKVFKKSSCVNSFILNKPNPAGYNDFDPDGFCIKCGACEKN